MAHGRAVEPPARQLFAFLYRARAGSSQARRHPPRPVDRARRARASTSTSCDRSPSSSPAALRLEAGRLARAGRWRFGPGNFVVVAIADPGGDRRADRRRRSDRGPWRLISGKAQSASCCSRSSITCSTTGSSVPRVRGSSRALVADRPDLEPIPPARAPAAPRPPLPLDPSLPPIALARREPDAPPGPAGDGPPAPDPAALVAGRAGHPRAGPLRADRPGPAALATPGTSRPTSSRHVRLAARLLLRGVTGLVIGCRPRPPGR